MKALDLVQPGEKALILYTRGLHFEQQPDGTGSTGDWVISPHREFDRVIIYMPEGPTNRRAVFTAAPTEIVPSGEKRRYRIRLIGVSFAGETTCSWEEFAGAGQNPIRYLH
jgi:hypothetical protein